MRYIQRVARTASAFLHRGAASTTSRLTCSWREYQRVSVSAYSTLPFNSSNSSSMSDGSRVEETLCSAGMKQGKQKASLVIFDKDGTLICFHSLWSPWAQKLIASIVKATGLKIGDKVSVILGYCGKSKRVFPGLLAEATTPILQEELVKLLVAEGVEKERAAEIIRASWEEGDTGKEGEGEVKSTANLQTLFQILKHKQVKVAVCTADNRRGTLNTLRNLKLMKYVDMVVCGDDPDTEPKPSPYNALKICRELGVDPADTAMVGDTKADVGMGQAAKLGWTVGVLSGVGDSEELLPEADYIISRVSDLLPLILPYKEWRDHYAFTAKGRILLDLEEGLEGQEDVEGVGGLREEGASKIDNVGLVIFDLHGTVLCLDTKYADWLARLTHRMEKTTGQKLAEKIYTSFGACQVTNTVKAGLLASSTHARLRSELVKILREEGMFYEEAIVTVNQVWNECEDTLVEAEPLLIDKNFLRVVKKLKASDIKIAVNTTAPREVAVNDLMRTGTLQQLDMLVCGDDDPAVQHGKTASTVRLFCEEMGVTADRTVVVGDTMADISMGLQASAGLTVGVLTGVGSYKELVQADHIVPTASHVCNLIFNRCVKKVYSLISSDQGSGFSDSEGESSSKGRGMSTPSATGVRHYSTSPSTSGDDGQRRSVSQLPRLQIAPDVDTFDYVIVGAGSAGCVLANRLSADTNNKVLILEAGPEDKTWKIEMPAALMYNLCDDKYNWYYHTDPEPGMDGRVMYWPRGRVWGGSSSLNAMVYIRGHALDYDRWQQEGAAGWSYADCLPYFRKAQTHECGGDEYRGDSGPLHVSRGVTNHELHKAFIEAGVQAGYPYTKDMNGYQQEGVGWMDMTIHKGKRWNAASAYLRPSLSRANLGVISKALSTRVLFDGSRAVGVEYVKDGQTRQVRADREVILSGGAINSPQLLMLSGVGDARDLRALDIPVVADLPGVGSNLQDHLEVYVQQASKQPNTLYSAQWKFPHNMIRIGAQWFLTHTGQGATTHLESGGFIRSRPGVTHPDIQYHFLPSTVNDHGRVMGNCHAYQVHVGPLRPTSRGFLKLRSRDPKDHPRIVANYLSTEQDVREMRDAVRLTREIFAQKAFDPYRGREIAPGPDVTSDKDIDAFNRKKADSAYHPSCTCKMGSVDDPATVVDPQTRVVGLQGLRVVDASIMPSVVSGNLNGPTIMVAEKAADIILDRPPLPRSNAPVYHPKSLDTQR